MYLPKAKDALLPEHKRMPYDACFIKHKMIAFCSAHCIVSWNNRAYGLII
jgi:hypothetical protein